MTYTHLTTDELVMIEAYYKEGIAVSYICHSLKRSRQTIYKVIAYLKAGHTAYDYKLGHKKTTRCNIKNTIYTHVVFYYIFLINSPIPFTISVTKAFPIKNIRILSDTSTTVPSESFFLAVQLSGKS